MNARVSREFLRLHAARADDTALGAWLRLYIHVAHTEDFVVDADQDPQAPIGECMILDAGTWTDRQWLVTCGTDTRGVKAAVAAGLCRIHRNDVIVSGVDLQEARRVRQARENGRGGRPITSRQGRVELSQKRRFLVLQHCGFRCSYCGLGPGDGVALEVDHVVAVANGGTNDDSNLTAACIDCNAGKSDREIT